MRLDLQCKYDNRLNTSLKLAVVLVLMVFSLSSFAVVNVNVSTDCVSCDGEATVQTDLGGTVIFEWYNEAGDLIGLASSDTGELVISNLCPGLYLVEYTNGSENNFEYFSVSTSSNFAGGVTQQILCYNHPNFAATPEESLFDLLNGFPLAGGFWTNPAGDVIGEMIAPDQIIEGLFKYHLSTPDCELVSGVFIQTVQNANPSLSGTLQICENYQPFELTEALQGEPDDGGVWFDSFGNVVDGFFYPETYESQLFTYMIDTVENCPAVFSSAYIDELQLPNPGENSLLGFCEGANVFDLMDAMNGNPDLNGTWSDPDGVEIGNFFDPSIQPEGVYSYFVSGQGICPSDEATLTLYYVEDIDAGISSSLQVCENEGVINLFNQLDGTPMEGGVWTYNGVLVDEELLADEAGQGVYTYTVEGEGCPSESSEVDIEIDEISFPGSGGNVILCENVGVINLHDYVDADLGGQWVMNGDNVDPIIDLNITGSNQYEYHIYSDNFCPDLAESYNLIVDELAPEILDQTINLCNTDDELNLSDLIDLSGVSSYDWIDQNLNVFDGLIDPQNDISSSVQLNIHSDNSCPDNSSEIEIVIGEFLALNQTESEHLCGDQSSINLGVYFDDYNSGLGEWSFNNNILADDEVILTSDLAGEYIFEIENTGSCSSTFLQLTLEIDPMPNAGGDAIFEVCADEGVFEISDLSIDLEDDLIYSYNDSEILDPLDVEGLDAIVINVEALSQGLCPNDFAELTVNLNQGIDFDAGEDIEMCSGGVSPFLGQNPEDGTNYTWSPTLGLDDPFSSNPQLMLEDITVQTSFVYSVQVDNGVCSLEDQIEVIVNPLPQPEISGATEACDGDEILISVDNYPTIEWSPFEAFENSNQAEQNILVNGYQEYSVVVSNEFNCQGSTSIAINGLALPDVSFLNENQQSCPPLSVELINLSVNEEDISYWWQIDEQVVYANDLFLTLEDAGQYDVTLFAESGNGCMNSMNELGLLEVFEVPVSSFDVPELVSNLNTLVSPENLSINGDSYLWEFSSLSVSEEFEPVYQFPFDADQAYEICLTVSTDNGCADYTCRDIFIEGSFDIYVPNAFTPDQDGVNDVFFPILRGFDLNEYEFSIYNRWGEQIFVTNNYGDYWQGNVRNGEYYAPDDSYVWKIVVQDLYSAEKKVFNGSVLLMR